ncbi:ATP-binding protein [Bacillus cereus]|uniref:ATP-binding protein n=1 Tax=Bacillus cereus TaxID=1396 RepID=UPI0021584F54
MKKIYVKYDLLKESPIIGYEEHAVTINEEMLFRLKNEIVSGSNSSYMLSGYRGSGKTSYINKLEQIINNENIVFIRVNFVSGDEKTNILRRIIRNLAFKFLVKDDEKIKQPFWKRLNFRKDNKHKEDFLFLELLNRRTFEEVSSSESLSISNEINKKRSIDFTIIMIIVAMGVIYTTNQFSPIINLESVKGMIESIITMGIDKMVVPFITILLPLILFIRITKEKNYQKKRYLELNTKTLYDDEIAELRLIEAIDKLSGKEINSNLKNKLVFVIDELDKIEDTDILNTLLGQLKPLMLEGNATFITIGGQKLYYMYELEKEVEDPLFHSVFSRHIHVPLPRRREFHQYFDGLMENNSLDSRPSKDLISIFVDSLVLRSNRSLRIFINLLKHNIEWDNDGKPFLNIRKDRITVLQAELLGIIETVLKNVLIEGPEPSNDFFITQLHLAVKNIQLKQGNFQRNDLINKIGDYPDWYWIRLDKLIVNLLNEMIENDLLKLVNSSNKKVKGKQINNQQKYYQWKEDVKIFFEPEFQVLANSYLRSFEEMNKILSGAYKEFFKSQNAHSRFIDNYNQLKNEGFSPSNRLDEAVIELNEIENFITEGRGDNKLRNRPDWKSHFVIAELLLTYIELIMKQLSDDYIISFNYRLLGMMEIDLIAIHKKGKEDIIFELKVGNRNYTYEFEKIIGGIKESYRKQTEKECHVILVLYQARALSTEDEKKLNNRTKNLNTIILNGYSDDGVYIKDKLLEILKKLENLKM